jgi:hypothetical protein
MASISDPNMTMNWNSTMSDDVTDLDIRGSIIHLCGCVAMGFGGHFS